MFVNQLSDEPQLEGKVKWYTPILEIARDIQTFIYLGPSQQTRGFKVPHPPFERGLFPNTNQSSAPSPSSSPSSSSLRISSSSEKDSQRTESSSIDNNENHYGTDNSNQNLITNIFPKEIRDGLFHLEERIRLVRFVKDMLGVVGKGALVLRSRLISVIFYEHPDSVYFDTADIFLNHDLVGERWETESWWRFLVGLPPPSHYTLLPERVGYPFNQKPTLIIDPYILFTLYSVCIHAFIGNQFLFH